MAVATLRAENAGADCTSCHDQQTKLAQSAHAALTCDTCHDSHEKYPHPAGAAKPACATCHQEQAGEHAKGVHGQELAKGNAAAPDCGVCHGSAHEMQKPRSQAFRAAVPDTCGMCHTQIAKEYLSSVHGKALTDGVSQAPLCTDCHGEHSILRHTSASSPVNAANVRETCGGCHGNVQLAKRFGFPADRLVSFDASFHGLAAKAGSQSVANCASCHGVHNILPSSDAKSMVNARNLPATCGRCHPGAGSRFAITSVHMVEGRAEPAAVRWVRQFYLLVIPLVIGLMILHNAGDWLRKFVRLRLARSGAAPATSNGRPQVRMLAFERVQHALLVVSFFILVWTGFALKYPDHWWAKPLLQWETAKSMRGFIHRVAAVMFVAVSVMHLVSLFVSSRLRRHWLEMWPGLSDVTEAGGNFAYNLGLGSRKPGRSSHSYIEKAEYWAVVWGAVVMIATGLMLWANTFALKWLPKEWLDVATSVHFYEAVLATLAIVIWHLYSVILDPDVYPMDTAWLTGFSVKHREPVSSPRMPAETARTAETAPAEDTAAVQ
jgi:cytochrome b subunit of formate dehydrogenase